MPYLDYEGVKYLWSKISMEDYPNNETLIAVLKAIDETKADKDSVLLLSKQELSEEQKAQTRENIGINIAGAPGQFIVIGEDGKPVAKTILMNVYYKGAAEPSNDLGQDGDLYLMKG